MRRNIFWVAYVLERTHAMGTVYAMTLDDADVCQMLPVRGDQFDQGVSIYIWCSSVFVKFVLIRVVRSFVGTDYSYGPSMVPR